MEVGGFCADGKARGRNVRRKRIPAATGSRSVKLNSFRRGSGRWQLLEFSLLSLSPPSTKAKAMKIQLVEIARSFAQKVNLKNYESADFFCSQKREVPLNEADKTSKELYEFCKKEVESNIEDYLKTRNGAVAPAKTLETAKGKYGALDTKAIDDANAILDNLQIQSEQEKHAVA